MTQIKDETFEPYKALYIHLPFCAKRCAYCDFDTTALGVDDARIDAYLEDLVLQIRRAAKAGDLADIETVYLGGGTPSYLGLKRLSTLLYTLSLSMHLTPEVECTMEANPESLTEQMVKDIWALGVNRLSIGVQSLDDDILKKLGRIHDADKARDAIRIAQTRFENVSVDMMCGIPGQDSEVFASNLREVVERGVKHVSIYPLTIEEGTPFDSMIEEGQMQEMNQDEQAVMMQMASGVLEPCGMPRYEVASYAYEGFECRHNEAYWTGKPYLGLGRSAVTMKQNGRHRVRVKDGAIEDDLDQAQTCAEDLMLGMRMTCGVSDEQVRDAAVLLPTVLLTFHELIREHLVIHENGRYRPTLGGWLCGNILFGKIYELAP